MIFFYTLKSRKSRTILFSISFPAFIHSCGSWRVEKPVGAHGAALGSFYV